MPDGSMEVVAEGPEKELNDLIEFCKTGPEAAEISEVDFKFEKANGEFRDFEVRF